MAKLADVATRAGVSAATVSRALNGVASVDPALVERVRAAAEELGYRPNRVARSLRRQRSDVWALLVTDVENPFFTAVARGVEDVAQANGFSVLLCNTDEDAGKEAQYLSVAELEQVAGVIVTPTGRDGGAAGLVRRGIPLVAVDRGLDEPVDTVSVDSRAAARTAAAHLLEQGWSRPACVTGPHGTTTADERWLGHRDALVAAGVDPAGLVRHEAYGAAGGRAAAASLLSSAEPPDAFLVANALMALGVLAELRDRGLAAARDVGLVAFDDAPWAELVEPAVTVVVQPAYEMGVRAAQLLVGRIRGERPPSAVEAVVLPTSLVVRDSSRRRGGQVTSSSSAVGVAGRAVDVASR